MRVLRQIIDIYQKYYYNLGVVKSDRILVAGAGGFIGGWLVRDLLNKGFTNIVAVDIKEFSNWYQIFDQTTNHVLDLRSSENCLKAMEGVKIVYNLAADMGGMGFIEKNKALCMLSVLINTNLIDIAKNQNVNRYFYASSACVYNQKMQLDPRNLGLKESDAYPADPEDGYGWEKLFSERMCNHYYQDFGLEVRVGRFHNVYGPRGTFDGGREKAPAAICRKVAKAFLSGNHEIEIWGDGEQTRSFTYIEDTIHGVSLMMAGRYELPLNIGSSEEVSINQLVDIVEDIAGIKLARKYLLDAPKGVRGRNSDNTLIKQIFDWEPSIKLKEGLTETYNWIFQELSSN
jgi:GDP-D-mannose 3',5'-epimerase